MTEYMETLQNIPQCRNEIKLIVCKYLIQPNKTNCQVRRNAKIWKKTTKTRENQGRNF